MWLNLNLYKTNIFTQDEEQSVIFSTTISAREKYILGPSIPSKHCELKMREDIIMLKVTLDDVIIAQSNTQMASTAMDQIGLFGRLI